MNRRLRPGWPVVAAAALAVAAVAGTADFGKRLEFEFADIGARLLMDEIASDVVIVGIDAESLATLQEWPWPRRRHATLLEQLAPARPSQLFLDIDFSASSNLADDAALEAALAAWPGPPVILPTFYQYASPASDELLLTTPSPRFRPHVSLASVNLRPGIDGFVRNVQVETDVDDPAPPPLAALLNRDYRTRHGELWIDYTIDPRSFRYVSYSDVLANEVPAGLFAGRTVFVGATADELNDVIPVPVHHALPGVVVQALAFESARRGGHGILAPGLYWTLAAAWVALLGFLFCRHAWRRNTAALVLALALVTAASLTAYVVFRTVLPIVPLGAGAVSAWLLATIRSLESETLRALVYAVGLQRRGALLQSIVLSSSDSIVCIDGDGAIKTANPAAGTLFHRRHGDLQGTPIFALVPSLSAAAADGSISPFEALAGSVMEHTGRAADGGEFPVELSLSRVRLRDELLYTAIIRDISERKAQQRQLQFQATHDPLTALPNRPAFAAHLDSLLAGNEGEEGAALLMIDLDRFKEVNDTLGHNVGDYVLHEVAARLARTARDDGFIARIGGDEFALVVAGSDRTRLSALSRRLIDSVRRPIETCGVSIDVGLSIGVATFPEDGNDAETLLKNADVAMYVAKRAASGFEYYDPGNDGHSVRKLAIATRLRQAIADNRLELHYQPKVHLGTGRVDGVEALVRWHDELLGAVGPQEFIALAESTDLIQPLSQWTLAEALRQWAAWRAKGIDLAIAVNVSARMLQDGALPGRVEGMLHEAGVPPGRIELEITESAMMHDPRRALQVIGGLAALGLRISIDDYGTGYSSLAYLRDLPVHALKLDRSFVAGMQSNDGDRVIVASTVQMAHAMKLEIVAEGVETAGDATMLRELGYDYAQGYWYSAPLPANALEQWLARFSSNSVHDIRRERTRAG